MSELIFKEKYLKYKNKFLNLRKQIEEFNYINEDRKIEDFIVPINKNKYKALQSKATYLNNQKGGSYRTSIPGWNNISSTLSSIASSASSRLYGQPLPSIPPSQEEDEFEIIGEEDDVLNQSMALPQASMALPQASMALPQASMALPQVPIVLPQAPFSLGSIDIYKFKLLEYPNTISGVVKFGDFNATNIGNVGVIKPDTTYDNPDEEDILYTIDYIKSSNIKNKYYQLYKDTNPKNVQPTVISEEDKDRIMSNIIRGLETLRRKFDSNNIHKFDMMGSNGYVQKLITTVNHKIIIFGDHHGSFHTFFRNMVRLHIMGVLDLTNYSINDGYILIFLGDIVDRGVYSLEIFDILFNFINRPQNNDKIFINKGNHEEASIFTRDGFSDELITKFGDMKGRIMIDTFVQIFKYCSTAIILLVELPIGLGSERFYTKYWLCHGLLPINEYRKFLHTVDQFIISTNTIMLLNEAQVQEIRWNDTMTKKTLLATPQHDPRSGRSSIGTDILNYYLEYFNFIIRGHEDSYSNAWLLKNGGYEPIYDIGRYDNYPDISIVKFNIYRDKSTFVNRITGPCDIKLINDIRQIAGPIQTISTTLQKRGEHCLNVLTISTNTAKGRGLTSDSFVILRHDNDVVNPNSKINRWLQS
jgi:hypothetical protein